MIERELRSTLTKDSFALEFPRARLLFRRPSKYGASTYAAISAQLEQHDDQEKRLGV